MTYQNWLRELLVHRYFQIELVLKRYKKDVRPISLGSLNWLYLSINLMQISKRLNIYPYLQSVSMSMQIS